MTEKQIGGDERKIIRALQLAQVRQAEEFLVAGGGALYPFYHGYSSLARIIEAAPEEAFLTSEVFLGALCLLLVKQGRAHRARALLNDIQIQFKKTYLFDLYELLVSIHLSEDLHDEQITKWNRLEGHLPIDQPLYDGLYYNCMLVIWVRLNRIAQAHTIAAQAIESYKRAKQPYLIFFIYMHLADLAVVEGDIKIARRHVQMAEAFYHESGVCYGNETKLIEIVWLSIDFELGRLEHIPARAAQIRQALVEGDSWAEIFIQICRIGTMSMFFLHGRHSAISYLEECQISFHQRHGEYSNSLDVILAHINLLEGRLEQAQQILIAAKEQGLFSAIGMAMCQTVQGKIDPLAAGGQPQSGNLNLRREIVSELIKASAAGRENQSSELRHHVEGAMRLAVRQGLILIFLEHREVVIKVSGKLATGAFARGHLQLARMAKQIHKMVQASYVMPESLLKLGITNQQLRVLTALKNGASNKQIARTLGVSEATVKFHLHNLFNVFEVSKRGQLIEYIELNG